MTSLRTKTFEKSLKSGKNGHHATVYDVQRDPKLKDKNVIKDKKNHHFPFVGGSTYKGEWENDEKHGFGTLKNPDGTIYEGDWKYNMKNGRGTLWRKRGKTTFKEYVGEWKDDRMHGEGTFYHENGDVYIGNFRDGMKAGRGKHTFVNGSKYEGEHENGSRCGFGTLYTENGDIYEGYWLNDKKEGPGKYSYLTTKKVYEGEWVADQPKCGEYRQATPEEYAIFSRHQALTNTLPQSLRKDESFAIPSLTLEAPLDVLKESIDNIRDERDRKYGIIE